MDGKHGGATLIDGSAAPAPATDGALRNYYLLRGLVAAAWAVAALKVGAGSPMVAILLLIAYPAWDAVANLFDALRNGGLERNPSQAINTVISASVAAAVAAIGYQPAILLLFFGGWAILAGLLQLITGVRRWRIAGTQWAMVLSGAQSMLAGGFFISLSFKPEVAPIGHIAGYASFGAFYFLVSALWLSVRLWRGR